MRAREIDLDTLDLGEGRAVTPDIPQPTEKQIAFLGRLLDEKDTAGTPYQGWATGWHNGARVLAGTAPAMTRRQASEAIDGLLALPRKQNRADEPEAGMYLGGDGTVYRVYLGQQSGRMLVKRVVVTAEAEYGPDGEVARFGGYGYEYLGAAQRVLPADATPMPLAQAQEWGRMTATCVICGRRLDDPESVDRGIGPVCWGRLA